MFTDPCVMPLFRDDALQLLDNAWIEHHVGKPALGVRHVQQIASSQRGRARGTSLPKSAGTSRGLTESIMSRSSSASLPCPAFAS